MLLSPSAVIWSILYSFIMLFAKQALQWSPLGPGQVPGLTHWGGVGVFPMFVGTLMDDCLEPGQAETSPNQPRWFKFPPWQVRLTLWQEQVSPHQIFRQTRRRLFRVTRLTPNRGHRTHYQIQDLYIIGLTFQWKSQCDMMVRAPVILIACRAHANLRGWYGNGGYTGIVGGRWVCLEGTWQQGSRIGR
jgi:hypothetical protein